MNSDEETIAGAKLIIPDLEEIRPYGSIAPKEIAEVLSWHHELHEPSRMLFRQAARIGHKLNNWRGLIPHGKWLKWCQANLPAISERNIQRYIQLWENQEWLEAKFKSDTVSDLGELPGVKTALTLIQQKNAEGHKASSPPKAPGVGPSAKERRRSKLVDAETGKVLSEAEPPPPPEPLPSQIRITAGQLTQLCPRCRALLQDTSEPNQTKRREISSKSLLVFVLWLFLNFPWLDWKLTKVLTD